MASNRRSWSRTGRGQYTMRLILLGEAGSGKSSLFHRIKYKSFRDEKEDGEAQTVSDLTSRNRQYDSHTKNVSISGGARVALTVMDTASRERVQSLTAQYYRRTNIVLLVCSFDSEFTLNRLTKWHGEAQYYIDDPEVLYGLVVTKSDLPEHEREVTSDMLYGLAAHYNISKTCVFEVSARTGAGVRNMLRVLCMTAVEQYQHGSMDVPPPLPLNEQSYLVSRSHEHRAPSRSTSADASGTAGSRLRLVVRDGDLDKTPRCQCCGRCVIL